MNRRKLSQNEQFIDCTGKYCAKCGAPLVPMTAASGSLFCGCPNCDASNRVGQTMLEPFKKGRDYEEIVEADVLKLGDEVVVVDKTSPYYGKEGKITGFDVNDGSQAMVEWETPEGNSVGDYISVDGLKKIFDKSKQHTSSIRIAPFKSPQQEAYLWKFHPDIAEKWYKEYGHHPKFKEYMKKVRKKSKNKKKATALAEGNLVKLKEGITKDVLREHIIDSLDFMNEDLVERVLDKLFTGVYIITGEYVKDGKVYYALQPYDISNNRILNDWELEDIYVDGDVLEKQEAPWEKSADYGAGKSNVFLEFNTQQDSQDVSGRYPTPDQKSSLDNQKLNTITFSHPVRVKCPNCGQEFDYTEQRVCPYCHQVLGQEGG